MRSLHGSPKVLWKLLLAQQKWGKQRRKNWEHFKDQLILHVHLYEAMPSWAYNGLGLRVGKTDSTGTYSYVGDGTSPASDALPDSGTLFTPGSTKPKPHTLEENCALF